MCTPCPQAVALIIIPVHEISPITERIRINSSSCIALRIRALTNKRNITANIDKLRQTAAVRYIHLFKFGGLSKLVTYPGGGCNPGTLSKSVAVIVIANYGVAAVYEALSDSVHIQLATVRQKKVHDKAGGQQPRSVDVVTYVSLYSTRFFEALSSDTRGGLL